MKSFIDRMSPKDKQTSFYKVYEQIYLIYNAERVKKELEALQK